MKKRGSPRSFPFFSLKGLQEGNFEWEEEYTPSFRRITSGSSRLHRMEDIIVMPFELICNAIISPAGPASFFDRGATALWVAFEFFW